TAPVLTADSNQAVNLDADCEITVPDVMGSATDNCTVTITQSPAVGSKVSLVHDGTTTVTVTATDSAGNTDIKNVVLTAKDVTAPVLTADSNQAVNLDADCEITVPDVMGSATDNCTVTITQSPAVGSKVSLVHDGTTTVTVTATDAAGNTDVKNVVLTAKDVTNPVLTVASDDDVYLDAGCEITVPDVMGSATDNCTVTITQSPAVGSKVSLVHDGTTTVTVTATDAAGNTDVKNVVLTAKDVTAPVLTADSNQAVNLDADCEITVPDVMGSATDNCTVTITQSPAVGSKVSLVHDGTTTVTVTATDAAGNTDVKNVVLTAKDVTAPVLTADSNQAVNLDAGCEITVPDVMGSATDNCTVTITQSPAVGSKVSLTHDGTTTVTVTATDAAGNTDVKNVVLTAKDVTAPVLTADSNQAVNLDAGCEITVPDVMGSAIDNCGVTLAQSPGVGTKVSATHNGTVEVTVTATDAAGNTDIKKVVLTAKDVTQPVLTPAANQNINLDANCAITIPDVRGSATDNCDVTTTQSPAVGASVTAIHNGTVSVVVTAKDAAGNKVDKTVILTAIDTTPPTVTAGLDISTNTTSESCNASVAVANATYSDNCLSTVSISYTLSGATVRAATAGQVGTKTFNKGITIIEYTVTDAAGHIVKDTKTVTVYDNTAPKLTAGPNIVVETDATRCDASVTIADAVFSDNCSASISFTLTGATTFGSTPGQVGTRIFNKGVTTITYTVTDGVQSVTRSKTVTVNDKEKPATPTLPDLTAECTLTVTPPTTTDNCDGIITGTTGLTSLIFNTVGTETIQWKFEDQAGNFIIVPQNVTITDSAPIPDITDLPDQVFDGCQIPNLDYLVRPTATDECDGIIQGVLEADFIFPYSFSGTQQIEWQYIDSHGNITYQSQKITLNPLPISGGSLTGTFKGTAFPNGVDISSCGEEISIALNLTGVDGTIVQWEKFPINEGVWKPISNTSNNHTAYFAVGALVSTDYRVLIQKGTCTEYSTIFRVRALPTGEAPTITNRDPDALYCLGEVVSLLAQSNYTATQESIADSSGDFNEGQLNTQDPNGWLVDGETGGFTAGGSATKARNWSAKTCNNQANGDIVYCSNEGKFSIAYGNYYETDKKGNRTYDGLIPTTLETPIMDLSNAESASLDFDQAYYFAVNDYANIEISLDGGVTYAPLQLLHAIGDPVKNWYNSVPANRRANSTPTMYNFQNDNTSIDLAAYLGENNVRIRWSFTGTTVKSTWAMDNIFVNKQVKVDTEIEWTDGIGDPDEEPIVIGSTEVEFSFTPDAPGVHEYGGTALVNGCRTYDADGTSLIEIQVSYAHAGNDVIYTGDDCGQNSIQLNAYDNTKTAVENANKGAFTLPENCVNCNDKGTGAIGTWEAIPESALSCDPGIFKSNNPAKYPNAKNDPDALFIAEEGNYTLKWTVAGCESSIRVATKNCNQIDFDGSDDYVEFKTDEFHLSKGTFSIEAWVKPNLISGTQTIFSKRNANGDAAGYDLSLNGSGIVSFNTEKFTINSSPYKINTDRWYHIAVSYVGGLYTLYIDGIKINALSGPLPKSNNLRAMLGAMDSNSTYKPKNHFNGWIDEVRVWNVGLAAHQLHQIMNQKLIESPTTPGNVQGQIIPIDIDGVSWTNLLAYFQMEPTSLACGYLTSSSSAIKGKLKNISSDQARTAPVPYTTSGVNDQWDVINTWSEPSVWAVPNSTGINGEAINWNIVKINHDVTSSNREITVLGLMVANNKELTITGAGPQDETNSGHGLWVTQYLKIDGKLDLVGESQLVQKRYYFDDDNNINTPDITNQILDSYFDETSTGYIERDQQGTRNPFNYNYWGSPVAPNNAIISGDNVNANSFTIGNVLRAGTITMANPKDDALISWVTDRTATSSGNAVQLSTRWLYTYNKKSNTYASWERVNHQTSLDIGLGYLQKGSGSSTTAKSSQNYVFVGKPNNGTILNATDAGNDILLGNPYPSAIDADAFIKDNEPTLSEGALSFWEHYEANNTHVLKDYLGGYALYNLSGGVEAITPGKTTDGYVQNVSSKGTRKPGRFVPVGQGFFVTAIKSGNVVFKNSQRYFKRESTTTSGDDGSIFFKTANSDQTNATGGVMKRVRVKFKTPEGAYRPLLLGFTPNNEATDGVDYGYDALNKDNLPSDLLWLINNSRYVIQGVGVFDNTKKYPFAMKLAINGDIEIELTALENFDEEIDVFVYDSKLDTYHKINDTNFALSMDSGNYDNRFFLAFNEGNALSVIEDEFRSMLVKYLQNTDEIFIQTPDDIIVKQVHLLNILGQTVQSWDATTTTISNKMRIPVKNLPDGNYVVKIQTESGTFNKKVVIKY
ncbi:putative secreted protein (Por secretion system target), partial [Gelidibacter sediminis]